ncbi:structural maintenance of chromosomes protein 6-like [Nothobranchius furzeri]|uniref:structural maintenance of chromosomes protein 6-like n=1 Tax=Nothobranchius furzeri TaxID=105023 RepID=UPI0039049FCE
MFQVSEMEKELEPMKEKLQCDRRATEKYDEKVDEWKNKVEQAEQKLKHIQDQLEEIIQQVGELQPKCAELETEAQKRNKLLKTCEVGVPLFKSFQTLLMSLGSSSIGVELILEIWKRTKFSCPHV